MNRRAFLRNMAGLAAATTLAPTSLLAAVAKAGRITGIDTHAHVFKPGLKLAAKIRYAPTYIASAEDFLLNVQANGFSHGVLIQPSFLGTDNSFMIENIRAHRDRLRGVAVVEPDAPKELLQSLAKDGIVGIRLNLVGLDIPDFTAGPWPRLLQSVADLDWHVEVHRAAKDLPRVIDPLLGSGVKVVVDHFGRPDGKLGVEDPGFRHLLKAGASGRVWVKISGAYRNGADGAGEAAAKAAIPLLKETFGLKRMVWGSDWPHTQFERAMDYPKAVAFLKVMLPDPKERKVVLVDTPASLFHFTSKHR